MSDTNNKKIPVYRPSLAGNERRYVNQCLKSTWISSKGEFLSKFEEKFVDFTGSKYAVAVSNGTTALHLAILALGIGSGDEVIVPTLTYISSVNVIAYAGAKPVFVDSEANAWQIDPTDIEKSITRRTKAIIVVHLYGHPCEMNSIMEIARRHHLFVIEDCAEAFGSLYHGRHVGNFGDIATFSFFGNKTITTGEGGMVTTKNQHLRNRVVHFRGQGLAANREYWHDVVGYNYRMTNVCAAIGLAQLENAAKLIARKRAVAEWYQQFLHGLPVVFQPESPGNKNSYWMCSIVAKNEKIRDGLRALLKNSGIETRPFFNPVHLMPMYDQGESFPVAERLSKTGMNLPSYPGLRQSDVKFVCQTIRNFFIDG